MRIDQIQKSLKLALETSIRNVAEHSPPSEGLSKLVIELEIPKDHKFGDLTTNVAMRTAKKFRESAVHLAGRIKAELLNLIESGTLRGVVSKVEVSAPGFINFQFSEKYLHIILSEIIKKKEGFGRSVSGARKKVNIEFVSANPTGPLTIAHGRQAAVGDALARILDFSGFSVCREYFINDVGNQIILLGESIYAHYLELSGIGSPFPKDGYQGEYIKKVAEAFSAKYGKKYIKRTPDSLERIAHFGAEHILGSIKEDLAKFGISFDKWFSQKTLSENDVKAVLLELEKKGYIYEKDGARWFKSTAFGDDKDRVVIKSDSAFTYLAPDIAYHKNKYKRGFHKLIDIWGPDHHGYIPRLVASVEALGHNKASIAVLIVQLATLFRDGVALSMSTRKGEFITLREVVDEVGCDVAKFFFLMRKLDSHLDFDLEVAKRNSLDNPVYYIQYAHARIASIQGFSDKVKDKIKKVAYDASLLGEQEELRIMRMLCQFPIAVEASARMLEPYRLIEYLNELAKIFHNFYTKHRVVSEENLPLTKSRLTLVSGVKTVLANGLRLLGISFPERM